MIARNRAFIAAFVFFLALTAYSLSIPFFWDGTFFSEIAVRLYDSGLKNFIDPAAPDTGGFPLYSTYLAVVWKLSGRSLAVSHIAIVPFLTGIAYEYIKLAKRFLNPTFVWISLLLLVCEPVLITQSILMGYDIFVVYFFLSVLNALLNNRRALFCIALTLLCLSSMRGIFLGGAILLTDVFVFRRISFSILSKYLPAVVIVMCWAFYHAHITGWYFFSPVRAGTHEAVLPLSMMLRQILFIGWKVNDFGRIALWLFFSTAAFFLYKKGKVPDLGLLIKLIFIPLLVLTFCLAPFANPVGPKYFIVVFLLLNIGVCYLLQSLSKPRAQVIFIVLLAEALISGNFWLYPERYGNGWDASLKVLPYFSLKKQMDQFIAEEKIPEGMIGTQFPLIADTRYSGLSEASHHYENVWSGPIDHYFYFLYSNVINTDIPEQVEAVKKDWELVKKLHSGQVYISLYRLKSAGSLSE